MVLFPLNTAFDIDQSESESVGHLTNGSSPLNAGLLRSSQ